VAVVQAHSASVFRNTLRSQCDVCCHCQKSMKTYAVHDMTLTTSFVTFSNAVLAERMVGYWHHSVVCRSVHLSVTLCIEMLTIGVGVEGSTIIFLGRNFLFTSSDTKMCRSATTHCEKPNCRNFRVWNSHEQLDYVTMVIPHATYSAVRFCSYRPSIGLCEVSTRPEVRCTRCGWARG